MTWYSWNKKLILIYLPNHIARWSRFMKMKYVKFITLICVM